MFFTEHSHQIQAAAEMVGQGVRLGPEQTC